MGKETKSLSFFQLGRCRPIAYLALPARPQQTEHCVLRITYCVCTYGAQWNCRVGWYQKKGDKKTGCPPDPHKHQIFTQATGLDQTCLLLCGLSALSSSASSTFINCFISFHLIQRVACLNHLLFYFSIHFLHPETNYSEFCLLSLIL